MKEFWLELEAVKIAAEKKVKKPPLEDPKVVDGAKQTMTKVAGFHSVDLTAPVSYIVYNYYIRCCVVKPEALWAGRTTVYLGVWVE